MHVNEFVSTNIYNSIFNVKDLPLNVFFFFFFFFAETDVSQPKGEWKTEDIATVGEVLLDVSIQLART